MADNINYKDAVIVTTLKKREISPAVIETVTPGTDDTPAVTKEISPAICELYMDLPFTVYSETVLMEGRDITYSYRNNLSLEGREVMALVNYRMIDMPGTTIKDETKEIRAFPGLIGETWDKVKVSPLYVKHFPVTKAEALAETIVDTKTLAVSTIKYAEVDKADPVPFYVSMCAAPTIEKLSIITARAEAIAAKEKIIKEVSDGELIKE